MSGKSRALGDTHWRFAQPTRTAGASLKVATLIEEILTSSTLLIA